MDLVVLIGPALFVKNPVPRLPAEVLPVLEYCTYLYGTLHFYIQTSPKRNPEKQSTLTPKSYLKFLFAKHFMISIRKTLSAL